jgi:hypothetical protein
VVGFFELLTSNELNGRQFPLGVHRSVTKATTMVPEQHAVLAVVAISFRLTFGPFQEYYYPWFWIRWSRLGVVIY